MGCKIYIWFPCHWNMLDIYKISKEISFHFVQTIICQTIPRRSRCRRSPLQEPRLESESRRDALDSQPEIIVSKFLVKLVPSQAQRNSPRPGDSHLKSPRGRGHSESLWGPLALADKQLYGLWIRMDYKSLNGLKVIECTTHCTDAGHAPSAYQECVGCGSSATGRLLALVVYHIALIAVLPSTGSTVVY